LAHQRCGKLIVATSADEVGQLAQIQRKAAANGVELQALSADEARALEPALTCEAALLSPSTGIVDSHGLMLSLQGDLENASGMVALNSALQRALRTPQGWVLQVQDPNTGEASELLAQTVVNAAGLHAPVLARQFGLQAPLPQAHYAKGNYFTLAGRAPFSRLIYPVPQAAGLGVHLTLDLGGQAKFGPDVQWSMARKMCKWTPRGVMRFTLKFASTGPTCPMALCCQAMPAYARKFKRLARPPKTF
jgi:L-2-hydroxyglutarate oxidase LhgO